MLRCFFIAGGYSSELFDFIDVTFHQMPFLIDIFVVGNGDGSGTDGWDDGDHVVFGDRISKVV